VETKSILRDLELWLEKISQTSSKAKKEKGNVDYFCAAFLESTSVP
jgi:hypothetical protein